VSNLDAAIAWHKSEKARLRAIDEWIRAGMQITSPLKPFVAPYASSDGPTEARKKFALDRLREATEDEERVALVRIFAAFEADFRMALAQMLHRACVRLRPANGAVPPLEDDLKHLPTMLHCMPLAGVFEPSFSASDRNALEKLRAFRNTVMHQGFAEKPADDVDDVATLCTRVVGVFSEGRDSAAPA
jgi:hypothetical protein